MYPTIDVKETGKKIRYYMQLNHLKVSDVQEYLCLACPQTIYHWMKGVSIPSVDHLYALSDLFGVTMDEIVQRKKETPHSSFYIKDCIKFCYLC